MAKQSLAFTKDENRAKNQIATPWHIVEFLSDLLEVKDKKVLDPTCGHGAMLEHAGERYGVEFDELPYGMICERYPEGEFLNASIFDCEEWIKEKAPEVILMNPPFNMDKTKGLSFVQFVANAANSGKLAAIVPSSCGQTGKKAIDAIKKDLLEKHTLDAVLFFSKELFYPSASVSVVCMIFTLGHAHSGKTWFADFSEDGLIGDRTKGERIDKDNVWQDIKKQWLEMYNEKPSYNQNNNEGHIACEYKEITAEDNWDPNAQITFDPALLRPTEEDFKKTIADYLTFKVGQLLRGEIQA